MSKTDISTDTNTTDTLNRYLFDNMHVRGELVQLSKSYQSIIKNHNYPVSVRLLLGELMAATCLLTATLKFEGDITVQLQGAPVFPPPTLAFLENSTLFRLDETVSFMEALRGGPNPVISNGQPGLTTNFILKEGGEETEGLVKYSTSDYGLKRVDAVMSGSLADDL